jgi:hypothetical protein
MAEEVASRRVVIESFVRALGGGHGKYCGDSMQTFEQNEPPRFENKDPPELGLGFGRIKFPKMDHTTPYIRIPWKQNDKYNKLRAQVREKET